MNVDYTGDTGSPLEQYDLMDSALNAIDVSIKNISMSQPLQQRISRIPAPCPPQDRFRRETHSNEPQLDVDLSDSDEYVSALQSHVTLPRNVSSHNGFSLASPQDSHVSFTRATEPTSNLNNNADDRDETIVQIHVPLNHTASAPIISDNDYNDRKRKRTDTPIANTSETNNNPVIQNAKQHVSFVLQDQIQDGSHATAATSTAQLDLHHANLHDMATGPNDKPQRTAINPLAEPMWNATRKHLISRLKASLRAQHLQGLLEDNVMPIEFFGADLMHRHYASNQGILSIPMQTLIGKQAREKAELVLSELRDTAAKEGARVDYYISITKQIYSHEEDTSFAEAEAALTRVTAFYEKSEKDRLNALASKERGRQPLNELDWTNLVCHPETRAPSTSSSRDTSRGRKRARSRSKENKNKQTRMEDNPAPLQPAPPAQASNQPRQPQPMVKAGPKTNPRQPSDHQMTLQIRQQQPPQYYQQQHQQQQSDYNRNNQSHNDTNPRRTPSQSNNYQGRGRGRGQNQRGNRHNNYQAPRPDYQQAGPSRPRTDSTNDLLAALTALTKKFNKDQ